VLEAAVDALFEPLRRGVVQRSPGDPQSLGLGLYIAREIAKAHGGDIECRPGNTETIFSVRLPRAGIGADSRETSPA
jgi:signal transduction histidine kinase